MAFFQDSVVSLLSHNMTILLLGLQILQLQEPQSTHRKTSSECDNFTAIRSLKNATYCTSSVILPCGYECMIYLVDAWTICCSIFESIHQSCF